MPYKYLEDIATADIAFRAWGKTMEEMFSAAADATTQVMIEDLTTIIPDDEKLIQLENDSLEMLLFEFLQEFIYYKDAEQFLFRVEHIEIKPKGKLFSLLALLRGEKLDPQKHPQNVDVKAVTMHRFRVTEIQEGWEAEVVLDI